MTIHHPPHEADVGTRRPHDRPGRPYAVPVPETALLAGALPRIDWSDAFAVTGPIGNRIDPQVWADAIFHNAPL